MHSSRPTVTRSRTPDEIEAYRKTTWYIIVPLTLGSLIGAIIALLNNFFVGAVLLGLAAGYGVLRITSVLLCGCTPSIEVDDRVATRQRRRRDERHISLAVDSTAVGARSSTATESGRAKEIRLKYISVNSGDVLGIVSMHEASREEQNLYGCRIIVQRLAANSALRREALSIPCGLVKINNRDKEWLVQQLDLDDAKAACTEAMQSTGNTVFTFVTQVDVDSGGTGMQDGAVPMVISPLSRLQAPARLPPSLPSTRPRASDSLASPGPIYGNEATALPLEWEEIVDARLGRSAWRNRETQEILYHRPHPHPRTLLRLGSGATQSPCTVCGALPAERCAFCCAPRCTYTECERCAGPQLLAYLETIVV
jgi:hypothetical protein